MKIAINREAHLVAFEVVMDIGREEKRKDVVSVLMRAEELGGRVTPEDICNSLLIDRPIAVGKTVIARCQDLELLDADGWLTPLGKESLGQKTVPLPEHGRYRILCTTDPLVPQRILDLEDVHEPETEIIVNARRAARKPESKSKLPEEADSVPPWLLELKNQSIFLPRTGERIRVLSIAERCVSAQVREQEELSLKWTIYPDREPELKAKGFAKWNIDAPEISHESVFLELLGVYRVAWDARRGVLRYRFKEVVDAERASMSKSLQIEKPSVGEYGKFDDTEIRGIPIAPRTSRDAQEWAEWLLEHEIAEYLDEEGYADLVRRINSRFPDFVVRVPNRSKMAAQIRRSATAQGGLLPPAYWYLQAPLDLETQEATL